MGAGQHDTGSGKPSRRCGTVGAAVCGVSQYASGAIATAGRAVGVGGEVGKAGWDRSYGAGVGCGHSETTGVAPSCVVEVESPRGAKLRLELKAVQTSAL